LSTDSGEVVHPRSAATLAWFYLVKGGQLGSIKMHKKGFIIVISSLFSSSLLNLEVVAKKLRKHGKLVAQSFRRQIQGGGRSS
jgi:hypothetical protein